MLASVHRRLVLAFLLPLGFTPKSVCAGIAEDSNHVLESADLSAIIRSDSPTNDFERLALYVSGENTLPFIGTGDEASNVGQTKLDETIVADVMAMVPNSRFDSIDSIIPVAQLVPRSSVSDLLIQTAPAIPSDLVTAPNRIYAKLLEPAAITPVGSRRLAVAEIGTTRFAVPEPTVLLLLAAGIPAIIGRRPRRRP